MHEFVNRLLTELAKRMPDMQLIRGRPRHSATQRSVESANKAVEDKMAALFEETGSRDWVSMLPQIVHAMNTTTPSAIGKAPYEVVYRQKPSLGKVAHSLARHNSRGSSHH